MNFSHSTLPRHLAAITQSSFMVRMEENLSLMKAYANEASLFVNGAEVDIGASKSKDNHANGHLLGSSSSSIDSVLITIGDPEPSPPKFPKEPKKLLVRTFTISASFCRFDA